MQTRSYLHQQKNEEISPSFTSVTVNSLVNFPIRFSMYINTSSLPFLLEATVAGIFDHKTLARLYYATNFTASFSVYFMAFIDMLDLVAGMNGLGCAAFF